MHFSRSCKNHPVSPATIWMNRWLICLIVVLLSTSPGLTNTIYRTQDAEGNVTYSDAPTPTARTLKLDSRPSRIAYQVVRVIDGDTVTLEGGKRVRLLGINAPEIDSRNRTGEPGGIQAKNWLRDKLQGRHVYLEYDQQQQDHYQRKLAHLHLASGEHINLSLVANGLATVAIIPPNIRYADVMIRAQQQAERRQIGIWAMAHYTPRPLARVTEKPAGWQRYHAKIIKVERSRRYSRLIVSNNIDIRIANNDLALFPPLTHFLNKRVEVRGWVSRSKNHFSIRVYHPSTLILK
ncbi:MAG: thermonuclease family protein [Nitrosomonas sp.]|nr:thermonuclease family protein [Nitrosomonas sp.]